MEYQLIAISIFFVVLFFSWHFAEQSKILGLPLVSGYIFAGILVGPYFLNIFPKEYIEYLKILDYIALPFIAFAAGAEIHFAELRNSLKKIFISISCIVAVVVAIGITAIYALSHKMPFLQNLPSSEIFAVSLLGGVILVAKSPSSAIAIIKELKAKGLFTQFVLGITIFMDAVVILLFAIAIEIANIIFSGSAFGSIIVLEVVLGIIFNATFGAILGILVSQIYLKTILPEKIQNMLVLFMGYLAYSLLSYIHHAKISIFSLTVIGEPLLACMIAGLTVANFTKAKSNFLHFIEEASPYIFVIFFSSIGIQLNVHQLLSLWQIAVTLVIVRLIAMFIGCYIGGYINNIPKRHRKVLGFGFITQAGISLSLIKEVGDAFPAWGDLFVSLFVGIVVINTLLGPPFFRFALKYVGESRIKKDRLKDKDLTVAIFGNDNQSLALAKQLKDHNYLPTLILSNPIGEHAQSDKEISVVYLPEQEISVDILKKHEVDKTANVVLMLDDYINEKLTKICYKDFGINNLVVLLKDRNNADKFLKMGALVADPITAIVNLLDLFVRSPSTATLLMGQDMGKDVVEIEIRNMAVNGLSLKDIRLPQEVLILSVRRKDGIYLSHGYTRLKYGDKITVVGPPSDIEEVKRIVG